MKATAIANANIALVKYWGKRDERIILPFNSSISVTLDSLSSITTVEFDKKYNKDIFVLDGKDMQGEELEIVIDTLNLIRNIANINEYAKVVSKNNFPTAAGLASSAAGGAALALAASRAVGLELPKKELSIIARRNSGSACRSIEGGFVEWLKGKTEDGSDSYGKQIVSEIFWPEFRVLATIVSAKQKPIKSRAGMKQSVATCPYYPVWVETAEEDCKIVKEAMSEKNFDKLGNTAEMSALKMHAVMMTTKPPIIYWLPETVRVMHAVHEMRNNGINCYFTIDGGPQVKVLCLEKNVKTIKEHLKGLDCIKEIIECKPGEGAKIINEHLF